MKTHDAVQVLIVGSGVAGSTLAAELAGSDFDVLTLEAGPRRTLRDMVSSQIWSRRLRWGGPPVLAEGDLVGAPTFGMGWGTGGAGLHWFANWYRLHEADFKEQSQHGKGLDWPIEYADLRPYYDRAQRYFGVSGDLSREIWSPPADPYPMAPLPELPQGREIRKGFDALGIPTAANSLAINSRRYEGRHQCILDGWCDAGCPIGALANPLVLQWPEALRAGARLEHDAYVTKLTTDAAGRRVTGAEFRDPSGAVHFQPADVVIIACHTVWNSRLLLLSANGAHPDGLANRSGLVGRHFMSHPSVVVFGLFDEPTQPHLGINGGNLLSQEGYDDKTPAPNAFGSRAWLGGQAVKPNDLLGIAGARPDLYGKALDDYLRTATKHFGNMTAFCEETSIPENRIELDGSQKDAHGLPAPRVINHLPIENANRLERAKNEGVEIFRAAGTSAVWTSGVNGIHHMGGTLMGDDPDRSVANSFGQTHELENLFIAGASLFPTVGAVNPTATLVSVALRTADYIRSERTGLVP